MAFSTLAGTQGTYIPWDKLLARKALKGLEKVVPYANKAEMSKLPCTIKGRHQEVVGSGMLWW